MRRRQGDHLCGTEERRLEGENQSINQSINQQRHSEELQQALLIAMQTGKSDFVQLLLDQDYAGELNDFNRFLTVERLYLLHQQNVSIQ
jgi:hypothetical protein